MSSIGGFNGGKGGSGNGNRVTVGRTIAGVFSGAAANIKSKLSNLNTVSNVIQTSSPDHVPDQTYNSTASFNNTSSRINHEHEDYRDACNSTAKFLSHNESFQKHTLQNPQQQYYPQSNHRWSEATMERFGNNKSVEKLTPNALPITVPGADVNIVRGLDGMSIAPNSCSTLPTSVDTLSAGDSESSSNTFGRNIFHIYFYIEYAEIFIY